jgi:hypothetical protein
LIGWAGIDLRAIGFHQDAAIGLLLIGNLDHVDFKIEIEDIAGKSKR